MEPRFAVHAPGICPHRGRTLLVRPPRGPLCCRQLGGARGAQGQAFSRRLSPWSWEHSSKSGMGRKVTCALTRSPEDILRAQEPLEGKGKARPQGPSPDYTLDISR